MYTIKITLRDTRCSAVLVEQIPITTGSRGQFQAELSMDESWTDLDKTVIFYTASRSRAVHLGKETSCLVPADVLQSPAATLTVGVQGVLGDTVWCSTLAQVVGLTPGAYLPAEEDPNTHPDLYSQLLADLEALRNAVAAVSSVNGETGDVILDAEAVGARPDTWMPTAAEVGARPDTRMPTAAEVGARPDTWMPTAADVGALPADTEFPTALPAVTVDDAGKFLRVSENGVWTAEALASAEGVSY